MECTICHMMVAGRGQLMFGIIELIQGVYLEGEFDSRIGQCVDRCTIVGACLVTIARREMGESHIYTIDVAKTPYHVGQSYSMMDAVIKDDPLVLSQNSLEASSLLPPPSSKQSRHSLFPHSPSS